MNQNKGRSRKGINVGEDNGMWKGDNVGYISLHEWLRNRKPKPKLCENCQEREPYDLANISGQYKRDISDYEWLCRKCHMDKDGRRKRLRFTGNHTEESKIKIGETTRKYFEDKEWKAKWIETLKGRKQPESFRKFMSAFTTNRERDEFGRFKSAYWDLPKINKPSRDGVV